MCSWTCWWFFLAARSSASEKASLSACWEMRDSNSSKAETLQYWPVKLGQYALKWTVGERKSPKFTLIVVLLNAETCEPA